MSGTGQHVQGEGQWAPGTVVREIEGHFNKQNEPRNAPAIDHHGGVPGVDFTDKLKEKLPGHHGDSTHGSSSSSSGGVLGSSHGNTSGGNSNLQQEIAAREGGHSGSGSGLTGSSSHGTGSGLTGSHGTGSGLTGSSHGTGSGLTGSQGTGTGLSGASGTGQGLTGGSANTGLTGSTHGSSTGTGLSGNHPGTATGAGLTGAGATGATGAGLAGTGAHHHGPTGTASGEHSNVATRASGDAYDASHPHDANKKEGVFEKIKHAIQGDAPADKKH